MDEWQKLTSHLVGWTCRARKLKCDEERPKCSQCARSRPPRECSYPDESEDPMEGFSGED